MSFVKMKFNRMLVIGTLTMAVNHIVMLSGSVVVGILVGAVTGEEVCATEIAGVACRRLNAIGCNRTEYRFDGTRL